MCYKEVSGVIFERKVFDKMLVYYVVKVGVDVFVRIEVFDVIRKDGKIVGIKVKYEDELVEIYVDIIVVVDGVESIIVRKVGINIYVLLYEFDLGYEYEMFIEGFDLDLIYFWFGNEVVFRGYVWVFLKDEDRVNVGIGINLDNLKIVKYYFDKWFEENNILVKKFFEINVGFIFVGGFVKEFVKDNVVVVGDVVR